MKGNDMKRLAGGLAFALSVATTMSAQERPGIVWWSAPVEPGEYVQVHGGAWGTNPVVEVVSLRNASAKSPAQAAAPEFGKAQRLRPVKVTETGVCFAYPQALAAGLVACRVVSESGAASDPFILNEPAAWWIHGDLGAEASPGGWIRFFGRCLDRGGKARAVLVSEAGKRLELNLEKKDVWSLDAPLAKDVPTGTYTAYLHNGCGGRDGWRTAGTITVRPYQEVWKKDVFDVTAFGAIPNDGLDDTLALQAALAMAATNSGGIVYLPRGRFQCNGTLQISPRTLLRGESRETSQLYWPDCEEPPEALIEGTHSFGVEDLFIHAGKYRAGIVCKNELAGRHELAASKEMTSHDITIRRVCFKLIIDQYLLKNTEEYEKRAYLRGNGIVIRSARFVRVEDCDIYCSKEGSSTLFFVVSGDYVRMANCRINGSGWAVVGGDKVIFEKNDAYNCTYSISSISRNLYWGQNRQHDLFTNNREAITHDGASVAFRGTAGARCDGTRMTLDFGDAKPDYRNGTDFWVGHDVQIIEGRGAGQTRTVTSLTNKVEVTIDRPWTIRPDATSRFVIAAERRRLLYVDNDTEDSSIAIQLYGGLTEGVLARNRSARSGGFRGFGMVYHTIIPLWFVQYIENAVTEGNSYRGPANGVPSTDSVIDISDNGGNLTLTRSCVTRRCVLHNNAQIGMASDNGLVENCTVKNADLGITSSSKHVKTLVLHGNRFENVALPLSAQVRDAALLHPAERVLAMLSGAETLLGKATPAAWGPLKARLTQQASGEALNDPKAETLAREATLLALRALSEANAGGTVFDPRVARALLGARVSVREWDRSTEQAIGETPARAFSVPLQIALAKDAPDASCTVAAEPVAGWGFTGAEAPLAAGATTTLSLPATSPEGAKGFFRLPVACTFKGDGWSLTSRHTPALLAENRLCQWMAAGPFEGGVSNLTAKLNWQVMTNATAHGEMDLGPLVGASGKAAAACAVLRVIRPTALTFDVRGPVLVYAGNTRVGTDLQRGSWGSVVFAPGDHVLKVVTRPTKKSSGWKFRISCSFSEACQPGDFVILPANDVLNLKDSLLK